VYLHNQHISKLLSPSLLEVSYNYNNTNAYFVECINVNAMQLACVHRNYTLIMAYIPGVHIGIVLYGDMPLSK